MTDDGNASLASGPSRNVADGREDAPERLGIVLLECEHYSADFGLFMPQDEGLGLLPAGYFETPATWPCATAFAVAKGADAANTLARTPQAFEGFRAAVKRLSPHCSVITADCGFFYPAREALREDRSGEPPVVLMMDILDLALASVARGAPVGLLTASEPNARQMLERHPEYGRLRIVGMSDADMWRRAARDDFALRNDWSPAGLKGELLERVKGERNGGQLRDVAALVLECTIMPQWRQDLQIASGVPVFDITPTLASLVAAAPEPPWRDQRVSP